MASSGRPRLAVTAETGTEDMPDAYRFVRIAPAELAHNVVAVFHPDTGVPMYQEIFGHFR